jgi:hypothetical protein
MKKINSQRGQSLVELSISLVLLLVLLSGAVEFGMAFFQFVQLQDAAQEGALYGSMNPSDTTGIMDRIKGASNSPVDLTGPGVTIAVTIDGIDSADANYATVDCEGHGLKVDVWYDHKLFMPFLPQMLGNDYWTLHASVTDTILSPVDCT